MASVSFCPQRTNIKDDWSGVQTSNFQLQQQKFVLQTAKYGEPEPYPIADSDEDFDDSLQNQVICECNIYIELPKPLEGKSIKFLYLTSCQFPFSDDIGILDNALDQVEH